MKNVMTESRLMIIAKALQRAGSVAKLSDETGFTRNSIYLWCDFRNGPSQEAVEIMQEYIDFMETSDKAVVAPVVAPVALPIATPGAGLTELLAGVKKGRETYNRPNNIISGEITIARHAYAKSGMRIIFADYNGGNVFVPPHTTDRILERLKVIPIGTRVRVLMSPDISGRSDYIAQELAE